MVKENRDWAAWQIILDCLGEGTVLVSDCVQLPQWRKVPSHLFIFCGTHCWVTGSLNSFFDISTYNLVPQVLSHCLCSQAGTLSLRGSLPSPLSPGASLSGYSTGQPLGRTEQLTNWHLYVFSCLEFLTSERCALLMPRNNIQLTFFSFYVFWNSIMNSIYCQRQYIMNYFLCFIYSSLFLFWLINNEINKN